MPILRQFSRKVINICQRTIDLYLLLVLLQNYWSILFVVTSLLDGLDRHNVLTLLNYGFPNGYSCETQLVVTAHDLLESFDSDTQADVLVLDFSKAFDTVPHIKLLSKLEAYAIHGPILHWIANFLTQRKMSVVVDYLMKWMWNQEYPMELYWVHYCFSAI